MQNARITLHPSKQRMQVQVDGILLADSISTLELHEHGYPPRHYFSREDARMDLTTVSEMTTCCPFKGHTVYFALDEHRDIAWSYEESIEGIEEMVLSD
ncbi:DUF427 domain-containing protein [Halovibrio sp. HP20-50]|uniref:DUF427 domain-containing protein n=1 Tax=Halovibrio sp. HP20-59 TaxID=3080275 RepID=UPI00294B8104|nr:DUF427 domain-containing protein [Halovibrio sp. HP20-59]MEA2120543.1 DUF427 domain-containing protein [Halovibrio sp. HP20-59]